MKPTPQERREVSKKIRTKAAHMAYERPLPAHMANDDEDLPLHMMNFTKGLPHDINTGLIQDEAHYDLFVSGICSGNIEDIKKTPLGPIPKKNWQSQKANQYQGTKEDEITRAWESSGAGHTYDLEGPDAQAVTMKPAPKLGSDELTAEMAEVYAQANLRDIPFTLLSHNVEKWLSALSGLDYFKKCQRQDFRGRPVQLNKSNIFRGLTSGDKSGPYISQFLLAGNNGINQKSIEGSIQPEFYASQGYINYGSITIDQRVRRAPEHKDYMTTWEEYIDVQNGADFRGFEEYVTEKGKERTFINTGRDLSTYVHYDALYEAYLNACLMLLSMDVLDGAAKFDEGVPFQDQDPIDKQQGFAHYGGPHILTLVTEIATRALKAVRYQKFNVHRRLRPEALAARIFRSHEIKKRCENWDSTRLDKMITDLKDIFKLHRGNELLPMAFCEGSPMHPSYGAGHATVAGACVTILKAFFNHKLYINVSQDGKRIELMPDKPKQARAFVPNNDGTLLEVIGIDEPLTLEGELNKLAANISIGRNWAGVHYYSDYKESMVLGEEMAIGLLEEQAITYNPAENFFMTVPKFDETKKIIAANGSGKNELA